MPLLADQQNFTNPTDGTDYDSNSESTLSRAMTNVVGSSIADHEQALIAEVAMEDVDPSNWEILKEILSFAAPQAAAKFVAASCQIGTIIILFTYGDAATKAASSQITAVGRALVIPIAANFRAVGVAIKHTATDNPEQIRIIFQRGLLLSALYSAPVIGASYFAIGPTLKSLGQNLSVTKVTADYFKGSALGGAALWRFGTTVGNQVSLATKNPRHILYAFGGLALSSFAIGTAAYLLSGEQIFYLSCARAGASALVTTPYFIYLWKGGAYKNFALFKWTNDKGNTTWDLIKLGSPLIIKSAAHVGDLLILTLLSGLISPEDLIAQELVIQPSIFQVIVGSAYVQSVTIKVANALRQRNYPLAARYSAIGLGLNLTWTLLIAGLTATLYPNYAPLLLRGEKVDQTRVLHLMSEIVWINLAAQVFDTVAQVLAGTKLGDKKTLTTTGAGLLTLGINAGLGYYLGIVKKGGLRALFAVRALGFLVNAIIMGVDCFHSIYKKSHETTDNPNENASDDENEKLSFNPSLNRGPSLNRVPDDEEGSFYRDPVRQERQRFFSHNSTTPYYAYDSDDNGANNSANDGDAHKDDAHEYEQQNQRRSKCQFNCAIL